LIKVDVTDAVTRHRTPSAADEMKKRILIYLTSSSGDGSWALTDSNGKSVDFRNVILIMTTNAGAAEMTKQNIGFGRGQKLEAGTEAIEKAFTPEFRNRLDAVIPFAPLETEVVRKVVDKFVMQLEAQLSDRQVDIVLDDAARNWLAARGYDKAYGARPLARLVQEKIKKPLADHLLFGALEQGGTVEVTVIEDELAVTVAALRAQQADNKSGKKVKSKADDRKPRGKKSLSNV